MEEKPELVKQLEKKYVKNYEVTDFKDLIEKTAEKYKNRYAFKLKDENGKIYGKTYQEYKSDVKKMATALIDMGFQNKKICIIGKNSYYWAIFYMAVAIIGVVVPLDKELHIDDIINFINVSESVALAGDIKYINELEKNTNKISIKDYKLIKMNDKEIWDALLDKGEELLSAGDTRYADIKINPDDMHILLFTSGTTGSSKAVCLSQKNICSNMMSIAGIINLHFGPEVLSILPIHHTYECTLGYLLVIFAGGTISYCEGLRHIAKNMQEYKPNLILCVPLLLENVHKNIMKALEKSLKPKYFKTGKHIIDSLPFYLRPIVKRKIKKSLGGKLRIFIVGAAAMNPEVSKSLHKFGFRVVQGYGLTECSPLVAGNTDFFARDDAAGLPIPNVEYKISNPGQDGVGEIITKGPNVMLGYYKDKEATNRVIKDGWFYTGDLGRIDENGFLYVTGRSKSVIVTKNGKNIYPEELEYYLNENSVISEAIVLGVEDKTNNETYIKAKVFPNIEAIKEMLKVEIPTKEQIKEAIDSAIKNVNSKIPNYKHIKKVKILDEELEKTTTKKIKRYGKNTKDD